MDEVNGEMRSKRGQLKASKSVVVCIAKTASEHAKGDLTFAGTDVPDIHAGKGCTVGVVNQAKYVGSPIDRNCKDDIDVKAKIQQASRSYIRCHPVMHIQQRCDIDESESSGICI